MAFFFKLFIYSFLAALSLCHFTQVFSSYGGYSLEWGLLFFAVCWLLIHRSGFSCCGELWHRGLFAPRHMGFSQTRYQTHILYIGMQILNHWATREVPKLWFLLHQISGSLFCFPSDSERFSISFQLIFFLYLYLACKLKPFRNAIIFHLPLTRQFNKLKHSPNVDS